MIYDIGGNVVPSAYNMSGENAVAAYDIDAEQVYPDTPLIIKVMTYNVGQWYIGTGTNVPADKDTYYYNLQNSMIADNDADIVIIEEYWKEFSQTGRTAKSMLEQYYPYIHEQGGDSGYFGRCICSKYPIYNYRVNTYANETDRYYDDCIIQVYNKRIHILVTHLGTTVENRAPQITTLISYLGNKDYFICGGDYNTPHGYSAPPDKTEIQSFLTAGFNLANCSTLGDFITSSNDPTSPTTWKGWIDNICSSANLTPIAAYVDNRKLDAYRDGLITKVDHMPFIATLQLH